MERKIVHVVGTGTIGEPLIGILCEQKSNLGIDEVTFHKQSPLTKDAPKIKNLIAKGARLAVHEDRVESFKEIGLEPEFTMEEAVSRSSVVIDCTPKGFGHQNKELIFDPNQSNVQIPQVNLRSRLFPFQVCRPFANLLFLHIVGCCP